MVFVLTGGLGLAWAGTVDVVVRARGEFEIRTF